MAKESGSPERLPYFEESLRKDIAHIGGAIGARHIWNGRAGKLEETARWIEAKLKVLCAGSQLKCSLKSFPYCVPKSVWSHLERDETVRNIEFEIPGGDGRSSGQSRFELQTNGIGHRSDSHHH